MSLERAVMVRFAVICVAVTLVAVGAARGLSVMAVAPPPHPTAQAADVAIAAPTPPAAGSGEASIAKGPDGHFWADAQVDGQSMHFLVDTGASAVALTADDARRLGINPDSLDYTYTVTTASGQAKAASVKLSTVSVGGAQVYDVQALVIDKGLETSLLGMTYLGRLSKFEATPDAMILKS
jgi:aspartyl protease family protein